MNSGFNFLVNLLQRRNRLKITPPPPRVNLTLDQFRQRPDLVAEARRTQADPYFLLQLEVLANESPANYMTNRVSAERMLGQIEGYSLALNNLAAMATPPGDPVTLEATFDDKNHDTNERTH